MASTTNSERPKLKPRGRPFARGNKQGKINSDILDATEHKTSNEGTTIAPLSNKSNGEAVNDQINYVKMPIIS